MYKTTPRVDMMGLTLTTLLSSLPEEDLPGLTTELILHANSRNEAISWMNHEKGVVPRAWIIEALILQNMLLDAQQGVWTRAEAVHTQLKYLLATARKQDEDPVFTVILLKPDWMANEYGKDTYVAKVRARNHIMAIAAAQQEMWENCTDKENEDLMDDFHVVAVLLKGELINHQATHKTNG